MAACPSGAFCRWTGSAYSGTISTVTKTGTAVNLSGTRLSLDNNRSSATTIYSGSGASGSHECLAPGAKDSSLTGWTASPGSVLLNSSSSC